MRTNSTNLAAALLAIAAISTLAIPAFAAEAPNPYGLWSGTVGKQKVMVVLDGGRCYSGYYYLRHAQTIGLKAKDQAGLAWQESLDGNVSGNWSLQQGAADMLQGNWSSVDGKRSVPIHLDRVAVHNTDTDECSPAVAAYNAALLKIALGSLAVQEAKMGDLSYRTLSVPGTEINTFEIPPGKYHVPRLNKILREGLSGSVSQFYECSERIGLVHNIYTVDEGPDPIQGNVLNYNTQILDNCGAYPINTISQTSWDLVNDRPIEPVKPAEVENWLRHDERGGWRSAKLIDLLVQTATAENPGDECNGYIKSDGSISVTLGENGLAFAVGYAHVIQACDRVIEVPFDKLAPFLSPEGKRAVAELRQKKQR